MAVPSRNSLVASATFHPRARFPNAKTRASHALEMRSQGCREVQNPQRAQHAVACCMFDLLPPLPGVLGLLSDTDPHRCTHCAENSARHALASLTSSRWKVCRVRGGCKQLVDLGPSGKV